jgi:peroxiredoxin
MTWMAIGLALTWVIIAAFGFLLYQLMQYNGRLLVRFERLESRVNELAAGHEGLPEARRLPRGAAAVDLERPGTALGSARPGLGPILRESRLARNGLSVGTPAPGFRLPRVGGDELSLDEYRGQSVLLVFSDPGCRPCQELAPKLERLHRQSLDLEVLMVSRGSPAANEAKIAEHGLTFPVVLQRHWEISRLYAMFATPIAYLLDEHLTVVAEVVAGADAILALATQRPAPSRATSDTE